jgi:hypothetical protein
MAIVNWKRTAFSPQSPKWSENAKHEIGCFENISTCFWINIQKWPKTGQNPQERPPDNPAERPTITVPYPTKP